jgi:[protein-PII] uridylyltransferase
MTADPIATLRDELAALDGAYELGAHGRWAARRRADLIDRALVELWERAAAPPATALLALGGYGRRLQLPRSDIDLLVLHDGADAAGVAVLVDALLYPLWDAGFTVGHAVRTPAESAEAIDARLDAWTAMLDARPLAGDAAFATAAIEAARRTVTEDPAVFVDALAGEAAARHERFGSTAHLLEPDLKEGSGGLRDLAGLRWLEVAAGGPLEATSLLSAAEAAGLDAAEEFLVRARSALHLVTDRRADRLVVELQPDLARGFGFADRPQLVATDALMRALFEHARVVEAAAAAALARFIAPGDPTSFPIGPTPEGILEGLARVAAAEGPVPAAVHDALDVADLPDPVVWTTETRDAFLALLAAGPRGVEMLDVLDRRGLLARYLPCWADVRCRPQRDPYHRFTVDAHLMKAAAVVSTMVNHVDHPDGVRLGALLHDIGKVGAGNHVPLGAEIAARQLAAMGLPDEDRALATFMVAEHLLLPDTATRRDLTDEDLIIDVAARVGTPERLGALVLLAEADAVATGPSAWTPWRRTLLDELVAKVSRVLERGDMGTELAEQLTDRIGRVRDLLDGEPDAEADRFVFRMPRGYFLSVEPAQVARHYRTIAPHLGSNEVRTASADGAVSGTSELLVVARDRPGLLSQITGALALGGISIRSAQVFTTEDGVAVDLFDVEGAFDPDITESRWREFRSALRRAIEGSISLEHRVADKRRHYPPSRVQTPVTVRVDNEASDFSTVIEVGAPDRVGLLHDMTLAFAELAVDVHVAKVATFDGRVVDAFYVRDPLGRKITDRERLGEIEEAVRERLG